MDKVAATSSENGHWIEGHSIFVRYLIVNHENNRLNLLTLPTRDGYSLPVFGSEFAARAFLRSEVEDEQWEIRESTAGELISLLMGHIADVELISPNPSPTSTDRDPETIYKRDFIGSLIKQPILLSRN